MDFNRIGTAVGFALTVVIAILTFVRQKRFESGDIATLAGSFLAGTNLPAAIFLCAYAFYPDKPEIATKLHGMEKFVSFAGLSLLLVTAFSLWGLFRKAYQLPEPAAAVPPAPPAPR